MTGALTKQQVAELADLMQAKPEQFAGAYIPVSTAAASRIASELMERGLDAEIGYMWVDALGEFLQTRSNLEHVLTRAASECESAKACIKHGLMVNGLGILQSTGSEVDRLAALYEERKKSLESIQRLIRRTTTRTEVAS